MTFLRQTGAALRALLVLTVVLGIVYPLAMTAAGRLAPGRTDGSLLRVDGRVVGSSLLAQAADGAQWFQPRPSAVDWAGDSSGGSNLSPASAELATAVRERTQALRAANPHAAGDVPAEAITASASGLDPHISPEYARWQLPRVAAARHLSEDRVRALVEEHTSRPPLGFLGPDTVNVTELNLALARTTR